MKVYLGILGVGLVVFCVLFAVDNEELALGVSVDVGPQPDYQYGYYGGPGYYYYNEEPVVWIGPGWYYGNWFGSQGQYNSWHQHHRYHNGGWGHGGHGGHGGGHGGHGGGGGGHHH